MFKSFEEMKKETIIQNANTLIGYLNSIPAVYKQIAVDADGIITITPVSMQMNEQQSHTLSMPSFIVVWHMQCFSELMKNIEEDSYPFGDIPLQAHYSAIQKAEAIRYLYQLTAKLIIEKNANLIELAHPEWLEKPINKIYEATMRSIGQNREQTPSLMKRKFTIHRKQLENVSILANFKVCYDLKRKYHFSDIIEISCEGPGFSFIDSLSTYPSWSVDVGQQYAPWLWNMDDDNDDTCEYGPSQMIRTIFQKGSGVISYRPTDLIVKDLNLQGAISDEQYKLYFQCMIEIAKLGQFARVVYFAPYSFSPYAYAFGFYSKDEENQPTLAEQSERVLKALNQHEAIGKHEFKKVDNDDGLFLRPFYFEMDEVDSRPVHFTKEGVITTYEKLIKDCNLIDDEQYPEGIYPDYYQLQFQPYYHSFKQITSRSIKGKLPSQKLALCFDEGIDFNCLNNDKQLELIGALSDVHNPDPESKKEYPKLNKF